MSSDRREYVGIVGSRHLEVTRTAGGNHWVKEIERVIAGLSKNVVVITGGCRGVDRIADLIWKAVKPEFRRPGVGEEEV